jgi:hypothetical protein
LFALNACLAEPLPEAGSTPPRPSILVSADNPYAPRPEDDGKQTAGLILSSINLVERTDLTPPRVALLLSGSLPSVCNELRLLVSPPDDLYRIEVEAFSLVDPDVDCENVFQQFDAVVLLGVYSPGRYTVWVNQGLIGDFLVF